MNTEKDEFKTIEKKNNRKSFPLWGIFAITCLIVSILYILFKDSAFNGYSQYTDFIIGDLALYGGNKTGEWSLFWTLTWIGCFICLFLFIFSKRIAGETEITSYTEHTWKHLYIFLPALIQTILYGDSVLYLWLFSIVFYFIVVKYQDNASSFFALFLFLYFDVQTIATILSISKIYTISNNLILFIIPTTIFLVFLITNHFHFFLTEKNMFGILAVSQMPLPLLLLLYLKNTYVYQDELVAISFPTSYIGFILLVVLILYLVLCRDIKKKSKISYASILSVFLYGSYLPSSMIVPSDMHHYGEQILPFQQIVEQGLSAYKDYYSASGLFPMITGLINALLFQNKATTIFASNVIAIMLFASIIILFISMHVDAHYALLFAFLFHMPNYCRTFIIVPFILFLTLPAITKNKRRFLCCYVFCSFLAGLYYPLFGLALLCSFLPYAFATFISYCKEKTFTKEFKTKSFYIETIPCLCIILASIPLLIRMAKHILAYSHQTILGDGFALGLADIPDFFIPYLANIQSFTYPRAVLYFAFRFLFPMICMWIPLLFLCAFIYKSYVKKQHDFQAFVSPAFSFICCCFLILPVCYTYTLVVMDENWVAKLLSRSGHVYLWIFGVILPIVLIKYADAFLSLTKANYILAVCSITIAMLSFHKMEDYQFPSVDGITNRESAVIGEYADNFAPIPVSDQMKLISDQNMNAFPKLSYGFISSDVLNNLYDYECRLAILKFADPDLKILGLDSQQMYYFLLDEKAGYSGKPSLAKSKEAVSTVLPFIDEHTIIGSDVKSLCIYLNKDMQTKGFAYDPITGFYLSKTIFINLYGSDAYSSADRIHTPFSKSNYIVKIPAVLGHSLNTLSNRLTESNTPSDFLYVNISSEKFENVFHFSPKSDTILDIYFDPSTDQKTDYNCLMCDYEDGIWLLPIGTNEDYATNHFEDIFVTVFENQNMDYTIRLSDICDTYQFYSMNEEE